MIVSFLEMAVAEFDDALNYYEMEMPGLGARFRAEVSRAISRISAHPESYQKLSERTRRCIVAKFPYGIIYHHNKNEIIVIAVASLHRKPDYWLSRI